MKIVITGGGGFIGRKLAQALLANGLQRDGSDHQSARGKRRVARSRGQPRSIETGRERSEAGGRFVVLRLALDE